MNQIFGAIILSFWNGGNSNALKHGRYSAEAVSRLREIATLLRAMKELARPSSGKTAEAEGAGAFDPLALFVGRGAMPPR